MDNNKLRELFKEIVKGKNKALREFFDLYGHTIYILAKSFCKIHEEADEVVNDVLVKVWNSSETVVEYKNISGWLYRIIVNAALDKLKQRRNQCIPIADDIPDSHDYYYEIDGVIFFSYYLKDLTEIEKTIMICKFVDDMTFDKIAEIIGRPIGTVTSLYYRILEKTKNKL